MPLGLHNSPRTFQKLHRFQFGQFEEGCKFSPLHYLTVLKRASQEPLNCPNVFIWLQEDDLKGKQCNMLRPQVWFLSHRIPYKREFVPLCVLPQSMRKGKVPVSSYPKRKTSLPSGDKLRCPAERWIGCSAWGMPLVNEFMLFSQDMPIKI